MPGVSESPSLSQGALCILGCTSSVIRQFAAPSQPHVLRVHSPRVSACELSQLLRSFLGVHAASRVCTCDLPGPRKTFEFSNPLQTLHPPTFPFKLLGQCVYYLPQLLSAVSGGYKIKQLLLTVLT